MFKKIFIALIAVIGIAAVGQAKDKYAHDASVLPKAAQTVIANNFKAKVSLVKIDKDFGRVSEYEVILTDGSEVTFDRDGNWKNVEVKASGSVPSAFIPAGVANYVKAHHKGQKVIGIEKEGSGYEVELSNGIDMKFNKSGEFVRYDD